MKKIKMMALILCLAVSFVPSQVSAKDMMNRTMPIENPMEAKRAEVLTQRLIEIKALDTKQLTKEQKKQLRQETKSIKKELKALSGGVYLSAGAIIIIVLLLILLL